MQIGERGQVSNPNVTIKVQSSAEPVALIATLGMKNSKPTQVVVPSLQLGEAQGVNYHLDASSMTVDLNNIGSNVDNIVFYAVNQHFQHRLNSMGASKCELIGVNDQDSFPMEFSQSSVVAELGSFYMHKGQWKFKCSYSELRNGFESLNQDTGVTFGADMLQVVGVTTAVVPTQPPSIAVSQDIPQTQGQQMNVPATVAPSVPVQHSIDNGISAEDIRRYSRGGANGGMNLIRRIKAMGRKSINDAQQSIAKAANKGFLEASVYASIFIAMADGHLSQDEVRTISTFVRDFPLLRSFPADELQQKIEEAIKAFTSDEFAAESFLMEKLRGFRESGEESLYLVNIAVSIGHSDQEFRAEEKNRVRRICAEMQLERTYYETLIV
ncbi:TerB family tellurite resistance protein [Vibrio splendidus]